MCIVHSTLRDATSPYTNRLARMEADRVSDQSELLAASFTQ
jgi:hypothetical protein